MRQLRATGWMHNRVRMIVASFLVKDLHLEWQHGARHFMHWLVDGDLASNQHGWQWTAGCGTDAAPYFRVFNPTSQGRKFDPDGGYVRRWVPELAEVDGPARARRGRAARGGLPGAGRRPQARSAARRWTAGRRSADDPSVRPTCSCPRRFCGPPSSGNGGWTAGALAALIDHDCPDDRAAVVADDPGRAAPAAAAGHPDDGERGRRRRRSPPSAAPSSPAPRSSTTSPTTVEPVPAAEARAASASYPGLASHPFPTCFACGTDRGEGDGLRIFPGRVADQDGATRVAADLVAAPERRRGLPRLRRRAPARLAGHHLGGAGLHRRLGRRPRPSG